MKTKKSVIVCLLSLMLCGTNAYALEVKEINKNSVTVTGETDTELMLAATVKDAEKNFYFFDEIKSDSDGNYNLTFKMPDDIKNKNVTVEIKPQGKQEETLTFVFSGDSVRKEALDLCVQAAEEKNTDTLSAILSNPDYETAFEMLGIPINVINSKPDIKSDVIRGICESGITDEIFAETVNRVGFVSSMKKVYKDEAGNFFDGCDFTFEGIKYSEETNGEKRAWIKQKMLNVQITTFEESETTYNKLNAYYLVNNAKYIDLPGIIEKYKTELEVLGTDAYDKFNALDEKKQLNVAEKIVTLNGFGDLTEGFSEFLKTGVNAVNVVVQSGNGGGGGSSSNNTSIVTGIVAPENNTVENKEIFNDVNSGAWYYDAVTSLSEKGIVAGKAENLFLPDDNVKREEFLAMLVRAIGRRNENSENALTFEDVVQGAWYENIIKLAVELELASGYSEKVFGVGDLIIRQDAAVFASRAAKLMGIEVAAESSESFLDDSQISDYAKESVYAMKNAAIISGMGDNIYSPKSNCTRAQAAVIVYKLLEGGNN